MGYIVGKIGDVPGCYKMVIGAIQILVGFLQSAWENQKNRSGVDTEDADVCLDPACLAAMGIVKGPRGPTGSPTDYLKGVDAGSMNIGGGSYGNPAMMLGK